MTDQEQRYIRSLPAAVLAPSVIDGAAEIARLTRENAELREMFSGATGSLASYAFREYGHDAKLYNGIADLQATLAASEQNAAYWACKATEEAEQNKSLRDQLVAEWALREDILAQADSCIRLLGEPEHKQVWFHNELAVLCLAAKPPEEDTCQQS